MSTPRRIANRFEIADLKRDLVGRGGMGEVYRATDSQTGETLAVKALSLDILARDPELLERFLREGEALRQLNHPNIVHMIAACEEAGRYYLVMEYVGGGSLEGLLRREGRLAPARAIEIALDLADALTRAHRLGIIHRDLKPANVLLAPDGTPRLADFGIAHVGGAHIGTGPQLTQTGMLIGTVDYLSPEACRGEALDERADIWAFGVLLFEMLSGRRPFAGDNLMAGLTAILTQPAPDLAQLVPGLADGLVDLVYRMLEKDREQRIPSVRLVGAELEALLKGRAPGRESTFAPSTPADGLARQNLLIPTTPFIGREAELAELGELLRDPSVRLLTILGAGGMGKTRLALEAARAQLSKFADGVWFVQLAPLMSTDAIVPTIAATLGYVFGATGDPRQQLLGYLSQKEMLLVLDNFEHLREGAGLLSDIITSALKTKIVVTSRIRLEQQGEHLFRLRGMDYPGGKAPRNAAGYTSVKLFQQTARRVRPDLTLASDDLGHVARICQLVEGLPLGIVLAAGWLTMLTPAEIASEISQDLDFLQTEERDVPERQRSVRALFDGTWNLLAPREQEVFCGLSVFRGGFMREAAQQVTGATLRELMSLVEKSGLHRDPTGRYGMHELLRQYAAERLRATPALEEASRDRHAAYYANLLRAAGQHLHTVNQKAALREIESDIDNIRMAWDRLVARGDLDGIDGGLDSIAEYCLVRGLLQEARDAFARAAAVIAARDDLPLNDKASLILARVQAQQGQFSQYLGHDEDTARLLQASVSTARALGARRDVAIALSYLGNADLKGDNCTPCREALDIFRDLGDRWGAALALLGLGWAALHEGNYPLARDQFQQSVDLLRELGDIQDLTESLGALGYTLWIMGDYEQAKKHHQKMLALSREIGDRRGMATAISDLGIDACGLQEFNESMRLFDEGLAIYSEIGDRWGISAQLGNMGEVSNSLGRYSDAIDFATRSLALEVKVNRGFGDWDLRVRGVARLALGETEAAAKDFGEALQSTMGVRHSGHTLHTLAHTASLLAARGDGERALEVLELVFHDRRTWQMAKDRAEPLRARLRAELPAEVVAGAEARARARTLEDVAAELVAELTT